MTPVGRNRAVSLRYISMPAGTSGHTERDRKNSAQLDGNFEGLYDSSLPVPISADASIMFRWKKQQELGKPLDNPGQRPR